MRSASPGTRIVVLDDDPVFVEFLQCALEDVGWEVLAAPDPTQAGAFIREARPDVIFLDLRICPGCSGWKILAELEMDPRTAHIPVIVSSAATDELRANGALLERSGIITLPKPFELDDLYRSGNAALAQRTTGSSERAGA